MRSWNKQVLVLYFQTVLPRLALIHVLKVTHMSSTLQNLITESLLISSNCKYLSLIVTEAPQIWRYLITLQLAGR